MSQLQVTAGTHDAPRYTRSRRFLDRLSISASLICAVHCAVLPLAITILPLVGLGFLAHGAFELGMILLSILIGTLSLGTSYRLHRRLNPILMMISGGVILLFNFIGHESHSELAETLHPYIAAIGGLMVVAAHRVNMKLCSACDRCAHEPAAE